jgi:hypothetical protein
MLIKPKPTFRHDLEVARPLHPLDDGFKALGSRLFG